MNTYRDIKIQVAICLYSVMISPSRSASRTGLEKPGFLELSDIFFDLRLDFGFRLSHLVQLHAIVVTNCLNCFPGIQLVL